LLDVECYIARDITLIDYPDYMCADGELLQGEMTSDSIAENGVVIEWFDIIAHSIFLANITISAAKMLFGPKNDVVFFCFIELM